LFGAFFPHKREQVDQLGRVFIGKIGEPRRARSGGRRAQAGPLQDIG
jgi:hypothetical protein